MNIKIEELLSALNRKEEEKEKKKRGRKSDYKEE